MQAVSATNRVYSMATVLEALVATERTAAGCLERNVCVGGSGKGYPRFWVGSRRTGRRAVYAHRAVWEHFNGPLSPGQCVLHRCDNTRCINPEHLFVGTQADNMRDMADKGRGGAPKGEKHLSAKLTEAQAIAALSSPLGSAQLARELGVTYQTVYALRAGITWRHLQLMPLSKNVRKGNRYAG